MKKAWQFVKKCVPLWSAVFFLLFVAALIVREVAKGSVGFADFIHDTSGVVIRSALAYLTNYIPFSLAEFLLLASPILAVLIGIAIARRVRRSAASGIRYVAGFLSVVSLVYTLFVFGYGTGYYGKTIDAKLGLERKAVSAEELYETAITLIDAAGAELDEVFFPQGTYSAMRFSYTEMNEKLNDAYDRLCDRYPSFQKLYSRTKPVMLSEPWTYTLISGVYCFFTGEANVNVNYPDFIVVSSAAHEMAHQRGITREDEANFVAFLVCTMSDDAYVRYCGYADVINEVMSKLSAADSALYAEAYAQMPEELKREYAAYSEFFDKYRENVAAEVSGAINDAYITSHGQPAGIQSYGLVVELVVAYVMGDSAPQG